MTIVDDNRLEAATSPYLQAHAENPVNWQPWDEQTLETAREQAVPIFLSIGYVACHWCHVMAEESFEDDEVAAVLNERYVPIKVDREERPDLDQYYQTACQLTTGGGGWPLSAWLTPAGRPFQLGTYFPKRGRGGQPGFLELLERLANAWDDERADVKARADRLHEAVEADRSDGHDRATAETEAGVRSTSAQSVLRSVDWDYGGFGSAGPKFPNVPRLLLLLRSWEQTGRDRTREAVELSLTSMADGGIYDHLAGGFHRYATDRRWNIPHFEKMAYDNAQLLECYARAAVAFDHDRFAEVARESARFLHTDLGHPAGGVFSSLGADVDGTEGLTYVWQPGDLEPLDETRRGLVQARFGIDDDPDVEEGCVVRVERSIDTLAAEFDLDAATVEAELDAGLEAMRAIRTDRPQPDRDEKVLAAWNGLAMSGLSVAGGLLATDGLADRARETLAFVKRELVTDANRLQRVYRDGTTNGPAFLDDYAAVARGAFHHYRVSGEPTSLQFALTMVDGLIDTHWNASSGRLRFTPLGHNEGPPTDPLDARDRSMPSPVALAIDALATAELMHPDDRVGAVLDAVVETYRSRARDGGHAALAVAIDRVDQGPPSLTIVGEPPSPAMRRTLNRMNPDLIVTHRPPGERAHALAEDLGFEALPPLWRDRPQREGDPTIYPCRGHTCGRPTSRLEAARGWLDD